MEKNKEASFEFLGNVSDRVLGHHLDIGHPMTMANGMLYSTTQPQLGKFQIKMVLYVFYKTRPLIKTEIKILETKFSQVFQEIKEDMQVVLCN